MSKLEMVPGRIVAGVCGNRYLVATPPNLLPLLSPHKYNVPFMVSAPIE